jgi:hypothetical protein
MKSLLARRAVFRINVIDRPENTMNTSFRAWPGIQSQASKQPVSNAHWIPASAGMTFILFALRINQHRNYKAEG